MLLLLLNSCFKSNVTSDSNNNENSGEDNSPVENIAPVIAPASPENNCSVTTHWLSSGNLRIGITSNGGGVINQVELDGKKIMSKASQMYGRAGQSCIRDEAHNLRYNPTQAGFNETIGTPCTIKEEDRKLIVEPRQCALWYGDGEYDFTEWENVGNDPYNDDGLSIGKLGYGKDGDNLNEKNLKHRQLEEVGSEFDYYGYYEDRLGFDGINIPLIYHYYEFRYVRESGHCISQFFENGKMRDGRCILNESKFVDDISVKYPEGKHPGTKFDMNTVISLWSLRHDNPLWYPKYRYVQNNDGEWIMLLRNENGRQNPFHVTQNYKHVLIISDSDDINTGQSFCIYRPSSDVNINSIIGVNKETNEIVYKDNRIKEIEILDTPERTADMGLYGFRDYMTGILNPKRLAGQYDGAYEAYRAEFYILSGTAKQIMDAVKILDKHYKSN